MVKLQKTESFADKWMPAFTSLQPICSKEQHIPGSVKYSIKRFMRDEEDTSEDVAIVNYEYRGHGNENNSLKLRFCVAGNMYCAAENCQKCT
ncbi:MAG: hypothetical protein QM594_00320, partial [Niabella sp.]